MSLGAKYKGWARDGGGSVSGAGKKYLSAN